MRIRAALFCVLTVVLPACARSAPITLSATSAAFSTTEGGADPADQPVELTGTAGLHETAAWTAVSDQPWLSVSPATGTISPGQAITLSLHVNATYQVGGWVGNTSTLTAPSSRTVHTAVWTGDRMVVWGGTTILSPYTQENTGSLYDPVTDSWQATTTSFAPGARHAHSAVWTGGRMIVWGGWSGSSGFYGSGAAYAPDNWFGAVSSVGAPPAREGHTAVWTGTEMIVWGGHDSDGVYDTGAKYDPVSDAWTSATSTTGSPSSRWEHVAVWTGNRMVIWGGRPNAPQSSSVDTGGLYDPATDTWTGATSLSGAPSPRSKPSAVWTGREMIIWGGYDGTTMFNTGARYDPVTNTWLAALPTAGAPSGREAQSAVWTGSKMIVWGGQDTLSSDLNTGGIYQPPIPALGAHTATITITPAASPPLTLSASVSVIP